MGVYSNAVASPPPHRFTSEAGKHVVTVDLPCLESLKDVDLDIGQTELRLLLPGSADYLRIQLPAELAHRAGAGGASGAGGAGGAAGAAGAFFGAPVAKFSRKRQQLTVAWARAGGAAEAALPDELTGVRPFAETEVARRSALGTACDGDAIPWVELPGTEETRQAAGGHLKAPKVLDCMDFLRDEVEHALKQCTVRKLQGVRALGGCSLLLDDFIIEGEASVSKGVCSVNATVSFTWEVLDCLGGLLSAGGAGLAQLSTLGTAGTPSVEIEVAGLVRASAQAQAACAWMKKQGACAISECLSGEGLATAILASVLAEKAAAVPTVLEERSMTQWAEAWIVQRLAHLTVRLFGGLASASYFSPRVVGDASFSLRDGKLAPLFQLRVECDWTVTASAGGSAQGTLVVSDFSYDRGVKGINFEVETTPGIKSKGQLLTAFRQDGVSAVRTILGTFITELQMQIVS